ncbi:MAG: hypothetical protein IPN05_09675 [Sulfuritalea sp.]|nr:hypothetical protein [Sulfuritalea sp.]
MTYTTNTGSSTTLAITVTPVDDASVLVADTKTVAEDNTASGNVLTNDSDVDNTLTVASFTIAGESGTFTPGQRLHHRRQGRSDAEQRRQLQLCAGSQLERHGADGDLHHQHRFEHHAGDHGDAG